MKSGHNRSRRTAWFWVLGLAVVASMTTPRAANDVARSHDDDRDRRDDRDRDERAIQHVVVIFQENVSFDHYFATYPHAANTDGPAFTPRAGTPLVDGLFPGGLLDHNPNSTQPFRLSHEQAVTCDRITATRTSSAPTTPAR